MAKKKSKFEVSDLRLSQDFVTKVGVRKLITTVPVRKPNRQEFIRVHPSDDFRLETAIVELKEERETYLVSPSLWADIPGEIIPKVLYTYINRQGVVALWPIRLPGEDGRLDTWNSSALDAAELARKTWIRVAANMSLGANEVFEATGGLPDADWPEEGFEEILQTAFRNLYIDDLDHPVLQRLRGEV
jgi:hypothetical protein